MPIASEVAGYVRSSMNYGSENRPLLAVVGLKFERAEMQMIRWMCGVSLKDRTSKELRKLVGVQPITTVIRSGSLRWYGHVMRKSDEDWVTKMYKYIVEGRMDDQEGHGLRVYNRTWQNLRLTEKMSMTGRN